jgi:hypothetical protein
MHMTYSLFGGRVFRTYAITTVQLNRLSSIVISDFSLL